MIKSAKNSFQNGLIMDIAPDNTGATYMTNALNATLITNNGNEMSLQNDMGNGRVETAFLPEGYIPVGTCEYGDIIYIASYNPIIDKSQIGSFPSPERNISSDEIGGINQILKSDDFQDLDADGKPTGTLNANSVKKILCDKYLHPGDKFLIVGTDIKTNKGHLSDYGSNKKLHDYFPKDIKIYVVSIEDSGKIVYLDNVKWNTDNYYINSVAKKQDSTWDIDSYREELASDYTVFNSKVSGKLALLIELERINGFSCSWFPVVNEINSEIKYTIYWSFNWSTDNFNINPAGYEVTWTGNVNVNGNSKLLTYKQAKANPIFNYVENNPLNNYNDPIEVKITHEKGQVTGPGTIDEDYFSTSYEYDEEAHDYKENTLNVCENTDISSITQKVDYTYGVNDDVVNNRLNKSVVKKFGDFTFNKPIEVTNTENGVEVKKIIPNDLSNTILNYTVTPFMRYGYLEDLAQTGQIDFSKIGTKHIELHTWKYYSFDNTLTLTWGMDGYTEPTRDITEVVFNFYDNTGLVATYVTKDKKSYNGVFTEYLTLNSQNPSHKLTYEIDVNGEPKMLESSKLYLVKILIKYRERNLDGTYKEDNTGDITEYRWIWTNSMYNEYYHQIKDFNDLKFELDLDLAVQYSQINATPLDKTVLYEGEKNSEITKEDNYYKHLKANITYNLDENPNIQAVVNPGLVNTYDTFRLNKEILNQPIYVVVGDKTITYEPNQPQTFNNTKFINGEYLKPIEGNEIKINKTLSKLLGTTQNVDGNIPEINFEEKSYEQYNDYFEFVQTTSSTVDTIPDWSSNSEIDEQYLKYNQKTASLSNLDELKNTQGYILKNVYLTNTYTDKNEDTYQPIQFTMNEILYSKFYEIVQSKAIDSILVKPLIYKISDLIKYNIRYDNNQVQFNQYGTLTVWYDDDLHKIRYRKGYFNGYANKVNFPEALLKDEADTYNLNSKSQINFYSVQETGGGPLGDIFKGITPFIFVRESDDGKSYKIGQKYIPSDNKNVYDVNTQDGGDNVQYTAILAIRDTEDQLHFTNTCALNILDSCKCIVSELSQLYYTNGEVQNIPDYKSVIDMVYLSPHSIQLSADVIFKIEISKTIDPSKLFNIGDIALNEYINGIYTTSGIDKDEVKVDNVTPALNRIIKNCPIHFKYQYIQPEFIDSGNPKYIVKCSNGSDFYTNKGLINNKLYWIDDEELKTPNSEFKYYPYESITKDENSDTLIFTYKEEDDKGNDLGVFNNIYDSFTIYDDEMRCLRTNPNVSNAIIIEGSDESSKDAKKGKAGPINPKETLISDSYGFLSK